MVVAGLDTSCWSANYYFWHGTPMTDAGLTDAVVDSAIIFMAVQMLRDDAARHSPLFPFPIKNT
jgi:hypothetical protein